MAMVDKKILITGGHGFLGQHLVKALQPDNELYVPHRADYDLRNTAHIKRLLLDTGPVDYLFHLAADVGGIGYNLENPYDIFHNNLAMGLNLINEIIPYGLRTKFVQIGTTCSYPSNCITPFAETDIGNGDPEKTNAPYGLAKRLLLTQLQAARKQYGINFAYVIPANLYGPGDNFDDDRSHVIPALIKKVFLAKRNDRATVDIWGTGLATRDFLYVDDAVKGIIAAGEHHNSYSPINIGSGGDVTIALLVGLIFSLLDYHGEAKWLTDKPDGQRKRILDITKARHILNWYPVVDLPTGLKRTIEWYEVNYAKD